MATLVEISVRGSSTIFSAETFMPFLRSVTEAGLPSTAEPKRGWNVVIPVLAARKRENHVVARHVPHGAVDDTRRTHDHRLRCRGRCRREHSSGPEIADHLGLTIDDELPSGWDVEVAVESLRLQFDDEPVAVDQRHLSDDLLSGHLGLTRSLSDVARCCLRPKPCSRDEQHRDSGDNALSFRHLPLSLSYGHCDVAYHGPTL